MTHDVRTASRESTDGRNIITTTGEGQVITTDFRQGIDVTVLLPPAEFSEVVEYTNDFYADGRLQTEGDKGGETERIRLAAGERRQIGEWLWGAGPIALIGVRIDN
ncbi:hypothetical protein AB0A73_24360 [Glycomyces sp. NPDC047369]